MKKIIITALSAIAAMSCSLAQTNLDLEQWAPSIYSINDPIGWGTINTDKFFGPTSTFEETAVPGEGVSSARLVTTTGYGMFGYPDTLGGFIGLNSDIFISNFLGGVAYTQRPIALDFQYKVNPLGGDTSAVTILLSHWDGMATVFDGTGEIGFGATVNNWTTATINIDYYTCDNPDTLRILATSSKALFDSLFDGSPLPIPGTTLYLDSFVLRLPTVPFTTTATGNSVSCGMCNGVAVSNVTGGTLPYTYFWSDPMAQTTPTATGLCGGTYQLLVIDALGNCSSDTANVGALAPLTATTSGTGGSCNGTCDGTTSVSVSGGSDPYTYLWNDPASQTTSSATALCAAVYNVTVTDNNGCDTIVSYTVTEPLPVTIGAGAGDTICANPGLKSLNGIVSGSETDGKWSTTGNGSFTPNDSTLTATYNAGTVDKTNGWIYLILTSKSGCKNDTMKLVISPVSVADAGNDTALCAGKKDLRLNGKVNTSGGTWASNGDGSFDDPALLDAKYTFGVNDIIIGTVTLTLTTTGNSKCTPDADSMVLTIHPEVTTKITTNDANCNQSDGLAYVTVLSGTSPYTYLWSDPASQTNDTASGLAAGTYNVTVTDSNSCANIDNGIISNNNAPATNTVVIKNASCYGGNDGSATIAASGGIPPYTYLWSDPASQNNDTAIGLSSGTYYITVTDSAGCKEFDDVLIAEPTAILLTTSSTPDTCGSSVGTATVSASGGTGPYEYLWSFSADTTATSANFKAGTYNVTVTDANNCTATASVTVTEVKSSMAIGSVSITNETSCGSGDGTAMANVTGGKTPYSYKWNDSSSQTSQTAAGLSAGIYAVVVTDGYGCKDSSGATVGSAGAGTLTVLGVIAVACNGDSTGSATISYTGGALPYTYTWSTNPVQSDTVATGLKAGTYTVTVQESNACIGYASIDITQPSAALAASVTTTNESSSGAKNGSATVTVSGGIQPYTYLWSDANSQNSATAIGLAAGTYTVTTTDANGCKLISTAVVNVTTSVYEPAGAVHSIKVFPNPANEIIVFEYNSMDEAILYIYSATGSLVSIHHAINKINIDVKEMSDGLYFYLMVNKNNGFAARGKFSVFKP